MAVSSLDDVEIVARHLKGGAECLICTEPFKIGQDAKRLECKHLFHDECILKWLDVSNTCPACRFELESDCPEHEERKRREREKRRAQEERAAPVTGRERQLGHPSLYS